MFGTSMNDLFLLLKNRDVYTGYLDGGIVRDATPVYFDSAP